MASNYSNSVRRRQQALRDELRGASATGRDNGPSPSARVADQLPVLPSHFNHALIGEFVLGPRCSLAMTLRDLIWVNDRGRHAPAVTVRFGGIANFAEVEALFAANHHKRSELAWLRYAAHAPSKPGDLYFDLEFERVEAGVTIHCGKLTVTEADTPAA